MAIGLKTLAMVVGVASSLLIITFSDFHYQISSVLLPDYFLISAVIFFIFFSERLIIQEELRFGHVVSLVICLSLFFGFFISIKPSLAAYAPIVLLSFVFSFYLSDKRQNFQAACLISSILFVLPIFSSLMLRIAFDPIESTAIVDSSLGSSRLPGHWTGQV